MVNNNRTVLGKLHRCRLVHAVPARISPTVTNPRKAAGKSCCQVTICISFLSHFNRFYIRCCALSNNIIIYMPPFYTCLSRLHTHACKNICMFSKQVQLGEASISTSKAGFVMYSLKHWRPPLHTSYCLISVGGYLKIYCILVHFELSMLVEKTVKTNAWSVALNLQ